MYSVIGWLKLEGRTSSSLITRQRRLRSKTLLYSRRSTSKRKRTGENRAVAVEFLREGIGKLYKLKKVTVVAFVIGAMGAVSHLF